MKNVKLHRVSRLGLANKSKVILPNNKFIVVSRLGLGVNTKPNKNEYSQSIILFFRSNDQAIGMPKKSNTKTITTSSGTKHSGFDTDKTYNQSFGFDMYREDLYGKNSKLYIREDGATKDSREIIENSYEINEDLSLKLKKKNGRDYYISNEFKLERGVNYTLNNLYYIPNLMISQNKEIIIYAKYFSADNNETKASITFSHEKGIQSYTKELLFTRRKPIQPIKIKTKASEVIDTSIRVSINIKSEGKVKTVGNLTILPNAMKIANYLFVNVYYNTTTENPIDSVKLTKELNEKAFGQAAISIKNCNNSFSLNLSPDSGVLNEKGNIKFQLNTLLNNKNKTNQLGKVLNVVTDSFYKTISLKIFNTLSKELKSIKIKDDFGKEHLILQSDESLKIIFSDLFNITNKVRHKNYWQKILYLLMLNIKEYNINFFPAFMCKNITSTGSESAIGYFNSKGLIISDKAVSNTMIVAHEIGHNLSLGHMFKSTDNQPYDLDLKVTQTAENIMDYVPDADRKSLITFQWNKMRNILETYNDKIELEISNDTVNGLYYLVGNSISKEYVNNSKNIAQRLFRAINTYLEEKHSIEFYWVDNVTSQKKILDTLKNIIIKTFNELCKK